MEAAGSTSPTDRALGPGKLGRHVRRSARASRRSEREGSSYEHLLALAESQRRIRDGYVARRLRPVAPTRRSTEPAGRADRVLLRLRRVVGPCVARAYGRPYALAKYVPAYRP